MYTVGRGCQQLVWVGVVFLFLDLEASGLVAPVIDDSSEIVSLSCGYTKRSKAWRFIGRRGLLTHSSGGCLRQVRTLWFHLNLICRMTQRK